MRAVVILIQYKESDGDITAERWGTPILSLHLEPNLPELFVIEGAQSVESPSLGVNGDGGGEQSFLDLTLGNRVSDSGVLRPTPAPGSLALSVKMEAPLGLFSVTSAV